MVAVFSAPAQKENIPTTENFSIEGKVKKSLARWKTSNRVR